MRSSCYSRAMLHTNSWLVGQYYLVGNEGILVALSGLRESKQSHETRLYYQGAPCPMQAFWSTVSFCILLLLDMYSCYSSYVLKMLLSLTADDANLEATTTRSRNYVDPTFQNTTLVDYYDTVASFQPSYCCWQGCRQNLAR